MTKQRLKILAFALASLIACGSASAQWQVPDHSTPTGRGAGTGFKFVGPCTSGYFIGGNGASTDPSCQGFTQSGTGAVTRDWQSKARDRFSVRDFGAKGDGTTDDTAAIQAAINAAITGNNGEVYFPAPANCYKTTSQLLIDMSGVTVRLKSRLHLVGDGSGSSRICNTTLAGAVIKYTSNTANAYEAYFEMRGLYIFGGTVTGSIGFQMGLAGFAVIRDVAIEGFDTGFDNTDIEQIGIYDSFFRFNNAGLIFHGDVTATGPNSITFINTAVANNSNTGITITHANALTYVGGTIQYNGLASCTTTCWGIKVIDAGIGGGYGTVGFFGMIFEGNGGLGDVVSLQPTATAIANFLFSGVAFERTGNFVGSGWGTNQISISGASPSFYNLQATSFRSNASYTPSGSRPYLANTSTGGAAFNIGAGVHFDNAIEAPSVSQTFLGYSGISRGQLNLAGETSGVVSLNPQAVAGSFVALTLPNTSGTVAASATPPLFINPTTGTLTCTTCDDGQAWATYTPTATCASGSAASTAAGRFKYIGKTVFLQLKWLLTALNSCVGPVVLSVPRWDYHQRSGGSLYWQRR